MDQPQPKHLSPWIAWSLVILFAGLAGFSIWYYYSEATKAYDNSVTFFGVNVSKNKTTATTSSTTSTTSTANWKTYTSTANGFSFKYPNSWTIAENVPTALDAQFTAQFNINSQFIFTISKFTSIAKMFGITGATSVSDFINKKTGYYQTTTITPSTINGHQVTKVSRKVAEGVPAGQDIFITNGANVYRLVFNEQNSGYSASDVDAMLSTFQFSQ